MRNIVMPIAPGRYDRPSLSRAIALAKRLSCHLDVVFLCPDPQDTFVYPGIEPYDPDRLLADIRERMEIQGRTAAEASRRLFATLMKEAGLELRQKPACASGPSGAWHQVKGEAFDVITTLARRADATVFTPETARYNLMAENVLEAALLRSGRPVLYLPEDRPETDLGRALIAWDGSSACVRAISAWMSSERRGPSACRRPARRPARERKRAGPSGLARNSQRDGDPPETRRRGRGCSRGGCSRSAMRAARDGGLWPFPQLGGGFRWRHTVYDTSRPAAALDDALTR
jgi:hypothetical protein